MEASLAPLSPPSQDRWYLPHDKVDGGIVIASVIVVERERVDGDFPPADGGDIIADQMLIRLLRSSPYYSVDLYDVTAFPPVLLDGCAAMNIVHATDLYKANGSVV